MTREQAFVQICAAVGSVIRDVGEIPSGELYARMMHKVDIHAYTSIVAALKSAKLIEEKSHLLTWIGPMTDEDEHFINGNPGVGAPRGILTDPEVKK